MTPRLPADDCWLYLPLVGTLPFLMSILFIIDCRTKPNCYLTVILVKLLFNTADVHRASFGCHSYGTTKDISKPLIICMNIGHFYYIYRYIFLNFSHVRFYHNLKYQTALDLFILLITIMISDH